MIRLIVFILIIALIYCCLPEKRITGGWDGNTFITNEELANLEENFIGSDEI